MQLGLCSRVILLVERLVAEQHVSNVTLHALKHLHAGLLLVDDKLACHFWSNGLYHHFGHACSVKHTTSVHLSDTCKKLNFLRDVLLVHVHHVKSDVKVKLVVYLRHALRQLPASDTHDLLWTHVLAAQSKHLPVDTPPAKQPAINQQLLEHLRFCWRHHWINRTKVSSVVCLDAVDQVERHRRLACRRLHEAVVRWTYDRELYSWAHLVDGTNSFDDFDGR